MGAEQFDAVVVGSGFGGSVMAYRLAEAGLRVLVLERGKAYPPGSFARNPGEMRRNLWDPSEGMHGLINVWSFEGIDAMVSSGLGGGSLIYANVLLRKDERWFVDEQAGDGSYERWPIGREDLEPHYDRVERMLGAQRYPFDTPPYDTTAKTVAMKEAAERLGLDWQLPPLAVAFANPDRPARPGEPLVEREGHNRYGVPRQTCRLCAECVLGCNYGAKQTLDLNYLSRAEACGAEIRTRHEVRSFTRDGRRWVVDYVVHEPEAEGGPTDTRHLAVEKVSARYLILGAGALGSTYLLLRARDNDPSAFASMSPRLGSRFSGNGDVLTFVWESRRDAGNGGRTARVLDPTRGPTITSAIRMPDHNDGDGIHGRGFYVEDAGFPDFVAWMAETLPGRGGVLRLLRLAGRYLAGALGLRSDTDIGAELAAAIGGAELSYSSMPLLSMGRDVPDGIMSLEGEMLALDWKLERSAAYLDRVRKTSREIADALDGRFGENPLHFLRRLITVHPLGGCPMGADPGDGVVDARGEVFGHENLFVVDGAAMPGPVGPNPALTIAAFSDRCADHLIDRWKTGAT